MAVAALREGAVCFEGLVAIAMGFRQDTATSLFPLVGGAVPRSFWNRPLTPPGQRVSEIVRDPGLVNRPVSERNGSGHTGQLGMWRLEEGAFRNSLAATTAQER